MTSDMSQPVAILRYLFSGTISHIIQNPINIVIDREMPRKANMGITT